MRPRVLLADDERGILEMLAFVLRYKMNAEIVGTVRDGVAALRECQRLRPELIVVDLRMPDLDAVELLHELRTRRVHTRVLIYTGSQNEGQLRAVLAESPDGLVHKNDALDILQTAIESVLDGDPYCSPSLSRLKPGELGSGIASLGPIERQVVKLFAEGSSVRDVASKVGARPEEVLEIRDIVMTKLGAQEVTELVRIAMREGLVE